MKQETLYINKRTLQGMETKKRLIECACKLFREKGYNSVTVDDIVKEANSSKGSFYTHFKTKEELLINMLSLVDDAYIAFSNTGIKPENSIEKISLFIRFALKFIKEEIGLAFISTIYSSHIKDLTQDRFLIASDRDYNQLLKKFIEEGQEKKEIKRDLTPEHAATILTSCIRGVIYDWFLYKGEFDLVNYGGEVINMMLNQLKL